MPFKLSFLIAILFAIPLAEAQNAGAGATLTGTVRDTDTGEPVFLATVALWRPSATPGVASTLETGAATVQNGSFRIQGVRPGRFYAVVSFIGYDPVKSDTLQLAAGATIDLGTIPMVRNLDGLGSIEVAATRDAVQVNIDRTVYRVADDPLLQGGSTSDALSTIPSVDVDVDGNVSLRGVSNVAILINGRPAPVSADFMAVYLRSLPAGTIEQIEVVPNPSAKYEPDGMGGIINIVTKKNVDIGIASAVTLGGDSNGSANGSVLVTYGRGPLSITTSVGARSNIRNSDGSRFRVNRYLGPSATTLDQVTLDKDSEQSGSLNLTAEYLLTPELTLTASGNAGLQDGGEIESTTNLERDGAATTLSDYVRATDGTEDGYRAGIRFGLRQDFGRDTRAGAASEDGGTRGGRGGRGGHGGGGHGGGGESGGGTVSLGSHVLVIDARLNTSEQTNNEAFSDTILNPGIGTGQVGDVLGLQNTRSAGDEQSVNLQVDYVRPLAGFRVELGYSGELEKQSSDFFSETDSLGVFSPDTNLNNAFDFDQTVHAGYLQLARQVGPLGIQAGLRGETASTVFALLGENYDNDYASLFPSTSLAFEIGGNTILKSSYSRRVNRPRTRALNPFPSYSDPLNVRVGNPSLKPEYIDALEFSAVRATQWGSVSLTPYYRRTTNVISRFQRLDGSGVTVSTFENLNTSSSNGLELIASYQTAGPLRGFASLEGFRVLTDGSNVEADLSNDAYSWGGRLNATYQVGDRFGLGKMDIQTSVRYNAPQTTEQGRIGARVGVNLAIRQALFDNKASLAIRADDPFQLAGIKFIQDSDQIYQDFERRWGQSAVSATLTFNFGQMDRRPGERPDSGQGGAGGGGGGLEY